MVNRDYRSEYVARNRRSVERYGISYSTQRKLRENFDDAEDRLARAEISNKRRIKRLFA
jgi:hypothetical protein